LERLVIAHTGPASDAGSHPFTHIQETNQPSSLHISIVKSI